MKNDCIIQEEITDSSGEGRELLGMITDDDDVIMMTGDVRRKKKRKILRTVKERSAAYVKRKQRQSKSDGDSDVMVCQIL